MEREDETKLKQEQDKMRKILEVDDEFGRAFKAKQVQLRAAAAAKATAAAKKAPKTKAKAAAQAEPRRLPAELDFNMEQAHAKQWMPVGSCYLWKSRGALAWNTQVEPGFKSCTRTLTRHGSECLRLVIEDAWRKYCIREGIPLAECPMEAISPETVGP